MPFEFKRLEIPDVILVEGKKFGDARGYFMETFQASAFAAGGIGLPFVQDNFSHSTRNVLRGLHFQKPPHAQGKLVMVLRGAIFDVAVDIRRDSPTFKQWVGVELSAERPQMLYIPPGFAHGFCVLSEEVDFTYKVTAEYAPAADRGILWNDFAIGIRWPVTQPILSAKDGKNPPLRDADLP